ncbi:RNA polymerase delta subunit [Thermosinus carboxydivorans Nor1]|uniref:RNAP delta factor n=1 Tax=Thermosinus carboxydivorans Nor1 TaxID=401526 RepID=A1HTG2_9FIRM|nr:DNA-directed RNA polymerase subunit delta [Thermosinus carboxydivorans]EAX46711.1 RNA polymerase delta subunit [Thermosinus carboxydivorans Nor1]
MVHSENQLSEVEIAYSILRQVGSAMYFRDLITEVLKIKGRKTQSPAQALAEVHTQINMDSRFVHMGKGMWGLAEWMPQRGGSYQAEETAATVSDASLRRQQLLAEIQQDYTDPMVEPADNE